MKINKYKFRPARLSTGLSIIGFLIWRDFVEVGNGVYAPVYSPNKKLELKRIDITKYTEESLRKVLTKAQSALLSLKEQEAAFYVSVFNRSKTIASNDAFGKYSENQVAEVFYQPLKEYNEKDEPVYGKAQSFNEHILNLLEKYGRRS